MVPQNTFSSGNNYNQQGLFWSKNDPPTEQELKEAELRLEKFYRGLLEKATATETAAPNQLPDLINDHYRLAADYFGEEYSWHKKRIVKKSETAKEQCPNCGGEIKTGVAFHFDPESGICVIDWKRAYNAGKVKKEDVPDDFQWWEEPSVEAPTPEVVAPAKSKK